MDVILPTDEEAQIRLSERLISPRVRRWFWDDNMWRNPTETWVRLFMNPNNFVVDIDGDGVLAFVTVYPRMYAVVYGASWGPRAMRCPEKWRLATASAMQALDLRRVIGITSVDNKLAAHAMYDSGMHFQGISPGTVSYNGTPHDAYVFEITREDLGLAPVEESDDGWKSNRSTTTSTSAVPANTSRDQPVATVWDAAVPTSSESSVVGVRGTSVTGTPPRSTRFRTTPVRTPRSSGGVKSVSNGNGESDTRGGNGVRSRDPRKNRIKTPPLPRAFIRTRKRKPVGKSGSNGDISG